MKVIPIFACAAAAIGLAALSSTSIAASKTVTGSWSSNFSVKNSNAAITSCDNSGGPQISFNGSILSVGGVIVQIKATNNLKGTKGYLVLSDATIDLDFSTRTAPFAKQGALGGVGGNPWIAFNYTNSPTGNDFVIGRCVQGASKNIDRDGLIQNALSLTLAASECSPNKSSISAEHRNNPSGVNGAIFLLNSLNNTQHQSAGDEGVLSATFTTIGDREAISTNGNVNKVMAGGNPHLYVDAWVALRKDNGELDLDASNRMKKGAKISLNGVAGDGYTGRCRNLLP